MTIYDNAIYDKKICKYNYDEVWQSRYVMAYVLTVKTLPWG